MNPGAEVVNMFESLTTRYNLSESYGPIEGWNSAAPSDVAGSPNHAVFKTSIRFDAVDKVVEAIKRLAALPAGWDGHGADPVDPSAAARAKTYWIKLCSTAAVSGGDLPKPTVEASPDGAIALMWPSGAPTHRLELHFDPSGDDGFVRAVGATVEDGDLPDVHGTLRLLGATY